MNRGKFKNSTLFYAHLVLKKIVKPLGWKETSVGSKLLENSEICNFVTKKEETQTGGSVSNELT